MTEIAINNNISSFIDFNGSIDKEITIKGMIQNLRLSNWGGFLMLRTPNYIIQCVLDGSKLTGLDELKVESSISITGLLVKSSIKDKSVNPNFCEIQVSSFTVMSTPSENPLPVDTTKKELNAAINTKFDRRPLTLRHPKERAIFRISSVIFNEFGNYLTSNGFTRICSPKIVKSGAEGGANIFKLEYFNTNAYLAQSPQFYKQMMVGVFGRVFEEAPVFRAEKHDTSRHLNEYISLDVEMILDNGYTDLIQVEVNLLNHIFKKLQELCANEIELLDIKLPQIDKIITIDFHEVHEIVFNTYKKDYRGEKDLAPEEETLICQYAKEKWNTEFVFVTGYPRIKRPFYTMDDPANPEQTLSFDLLFRGLEITTGGQRLYKYEDYIAKMKDFGLKTELFESYLQTFRFGMPPHGGLGLGLERLTALLCNLANVKEASLFPRDLNRLEP